MHHSLHHLIAYQAKFNPRAPAMLDGAGKVLADYAALWWQVKSCGANFRKIGIKRGDRVAIYLEKRVEMVVAAFACSTIGAVFVPVNPLLKPVQVAHIVGDCAARLLVSSQIRWQLLDSTFQSFDSLRVQLVDQFSYCESNAVGRETYGWSVMQALSAEDNEINQTEQDLAAIFYTSGSTGKPKGVMLSHRNLIAGAQSVASYLENRPADRLLAALPLSFDAGFSQLTTAFYSGASVALINYLFPQDLLRSLVQAEITGLTAVPPLWVQLAGLTWPESVTGHLRYIANTGGKMPRAILAKLQLALPKTKVFLMYGLTEAFRASYLDPEQVEKRPDSIGKAIPNAELLVLRPDGSTCAANEVGELVQLGPHVAMGYWNAPALTAERFKPLSGDADWQQAGRAAPRIAVFSGDRARFDDEGFLYFEGRADDMIKTSGYRVSPTELEEIAYQVKGVMEVAAIGLSNEQLGQVIALVVHAVPEDEAVLLNDLRQHFKTSLAQFMQPTRIELRAMALPRNPNGKIDRSLLLQQLTVALAESGEDKPSL